VAKSYLERKRSWLDRAASRKELRRIHRQLLARTQDIHSEFLAAFGPEYLEVRSQAARLQVAHRLAELVKEHPGLSLAELEALAHRRATAGEERLAPDELQPAVDARSKHSMRRGVFSDEYKAACDLLRKIAMHCHPDRLASLDIAWQCRKRLATVWHETNALRAQKDNEDLIAGQAGHLRQRLRLVRHILALADIEDIDPRYCIIGDSLDERMEWLTQEARELEDNVMRDRLRISSLNSDEELQYMQTVMAADEDQKAAELGSLRMHASQMRRTAEKLEQSIERQSRRQIN
jgi:hypothetical protein